MKQLFIAATRQNDGKTMVSIGLFYALQKRFEKMAYIKPVGQQYHVVEGNKIDKDALLFSEIYKLKDPLPLMSPIAVPKGFTEDYIQIGEKAAIETQFLSAYKLLIQDKDFLLIEGTGHAGVGSVFDMSNAKVAQLVGAKVILVSLGGLGRAIDEIMLNKAVFDLMGVELLGVIINKVKMDKYDKINPLIRQGLKRQGIRVLGAVPFVDMLTKPIVMSLFESLKGENLTGDVGLYNRVEQVMVGDMVPHDALDSLLPKTLLVVPANREGLIMTTLCESVLSSGVVSSISGIVFTNSHRPHGKIFDLIKRSHIPMMIVKEDSFSVATKINSMLVKVRIEEKEKIVKMQNLVEEYVDIEAIVTSL